MMESSKLLYGIVRRNKMTINERDIFDILWDEACELARQRANEEGDIDIDTDYTLMEEWQEEYFIDLCQQYELNPYDSEYV